jgi:hypothetical protein
MLYFLFNKCTVLCVTKCLGALMYLQVTSSWRWNYYKKVSGINPCLFVFMSQSNSRSMLDWRVKLARFFRDSESVKYLVILNDFLNNHYGSQLMLRHFHYTNISNIHSSRYFRYVRWLSNRVVSHSKNDYYPIPENGLNFAHIYMLINLGRLSLGYS